LIIKSTAAIAKGMPMRIDQRNLYLGSGGSGGGWFCGGIQYGGFMMIILSQFS